LPPSATALHSAGGEISRHGSALFRVSIRPAAKLLGISKRGNIYLRKITS
jgi:hypothetical protein